MSEQDLWRASALRLLESPVWRGQHSGAEQIETRLPTIAFGSREVAKLYALEPNDPDDDVVRSLLFEARLSPKNPLVTCDPKWVDPFWDLDEIARTFGRDVMEIVAMQCRFSITDTNSYEKLHTETGFYFDEMIAAWPERISHLPPVEVWRALGIPDVTNILRARGHDLVVLGGSGESAGELEWHVLDPSIIEVLSVVELDAALPDMQPG